MKNILVYIFCLVTILYSSAIQIDGEFSDWELDSSILYFEDTISDTQGADLLSISITNDHNFLFIKIKLDREIEDFSLSVSSPGIYSPFIVPNQFFKNYNNKVDILMKSGQMFQGILQEFDCKTETIYLKSKKNLKNNFKLSEIKKINKSKN